MSMDLPILHEGLNATGGAVRLYTVSDMAIDTHHGWPELPDVFEYVVELSEGDQLRMALLELTPHYLRIMLEVLFAGAALLAVICASAQLVTWGSI